MDGLVRSLRFAVVICVTIATLSFVDTSIASAQVTNCVFCPTVVVTNVTLGATTVLPDQGPLQFSFTVENNGTGTADYEASCVPSGTQVSCTTNPSTFSLGTGGSQVISGTYNTKGVGKFTILLIGSIDGGVADTVVGGPITVAGPSFISNVRPLPGAGFSIADTLLAKLSDSSGINTASVKLIIDDTVRSATVGPDSLSALGGALNLLGGNHVWKTYGCALDGRCDTVTTTFISTQPASLWALDDSLPPANGTGQVGILGGLPLPPEDLRGCPVNTDDPEIGLSPGNKIYQWTPEGFVFPAIVGYGDTLTIATVTVDHKAVDGITCAGSFVFAPSFDWNEWTGSDPNDVLWDVYPYSDSTELGSLNSKPTRRLREGFGDGFEVAFARSPHGPNAGHQVDQRIVQEPAVAETPPRQGFRLLSRAAMASGIHARSIAMLPNPGAIKPTTWKVWLNDSLIVNNGVAVSGSNATVKTLTLLNQQAVIPISSALVHKYDQAHPTSDHGGWNEVVAQISDSTGHTTKVRGRYVQVLPGSKAPIALTALRAFSRLDQGECPAFGVIQCGGIMLTHAIPGFTSRDKARSLHLVYRSGSQRGPTPLPVQINISRYQKAPDSLRVVPRQGAVTKGDTLRYAGLRGAPGDAGVIPLWEDANEERVLGAELKAPTTGQDTVRTITIAVTGYYGALGTQTDTVTQEVVQLYLSDTSSTRFGLGWQLAELGRLVLGQTSQGLAAAIWLSGDGSYTIFRKSGSTWLAPTGETAAMTENTSVTQADSARYFINLDNGARIGFRPDGWQAWTADLVGNRTKYVYSTGGSIRKLTKITDPNGTGFEFGYTGSTGMATQIRVRAAGAGQADTVAKLTYDGSSRLTRVILFNGPAGKDTTSFAYDAVTTAGAYLTSVTDPRSTGAAPIVSTFVYDSIVRIPDSVLTPSANAGSGTWKSYYRDVWRRTLPRTGHGRILAGSVLERLPFTGQLIGTEVKATGLPTDFTVDRFGYPTWVRVVAPPANLTFTFYLQTFGGDDVRRITRDSVGRVTRIVHAPDSAAIADSVMYRYDGFGQVDRVIRNSLAFYPSSPTLDTLTFAFDSVAPLSTGGRCRRLRVSVDAMGGRDSVYYGSGTGAGACRPTKAVTAGKDSTSFTYGAGAFTVGNAIAGRPTSTTSQAGISTNISYDGTTWNTRTTTRTSDTAVDSAWYGSRGWVDSTRDAVGVKTKLLYDSLGRVTHSKIGTGSLAPVTRSTYLKGGLVSQVDVYASSGEVISTPSGTIQSTKYFYNRAGQVDSTLMPGSRPTSRKTATTGWNPYGVATFSFPGNGSYVGRTVDWLGRTVQLIQSDLRPGFSVGGEAFADSPTTAAYLLLNMGSGQLSGGQTQSWTFDNKGRATSAGSVDGYAKFGNTRTMSYSRAGQVTTDTLSFTDGLTIARRYEYNRRGQRTLAVTSSIKVNGATIGGGEARDSIVSLYDSINHPGRLIETRAYADTAYYALVRYFYDFASRDSMRVLKLAPGTSGDTIKTLTLYDLSGRVKQIKTTSFSPSKTWYDFSTPSYNKADELLGNASQEPNQSATRDSMIYTTDGTRRLLSQNRGVGNPGAVWLYDVFGNRIRETPVNTVCGGPDTLTYASDNRVVSRRSPGCSAYHWYWTDHAGNRLGSADSSSGTPDPMASRMSYTAKGELFFAMTKTASAGLEYDMNWHWYDASGLRVATEVQQGTIYGPTVNVPGAGNRTYYVYDGGDIALTIVRTAAGTFGVRQRFLSTGIDQQVVVRSRPGPTGSFLNLALVGDRQGSTLVAVKANGLQENGATYFSRNAFGSTPGASGAGSSTNTETGFTGASAPNQTGGFTYMRNRWYDGQTGRFLTQDPIGLAGGVNLYAYAGNNPIAFEDPFGLGPCEQAGNCTQSEVQPKGVVSASVGACAALGQLGGCVSLGIAKSRGSGQTTPFFKFAFAGGIGGSVSTPEVAYQPGGMKDFFAPNTQPHGDHEDIKVVSVSISAPAAGVSMDFDTMKNWKPTGGLSLSRGAGTGAFITGTFKTFDLKKLILGDE